jgi:YfiH family protein
VKVRCGDAVAHLRYSTISDGDFHIESNPAALRHRRHAFAPGAWTQLDEVHGTVVRVVTEPGEHDGAVGDAAITRCRGAVLSVWVGDCAPVLLVGVDEHGDGVIGAAHAGWRGALDGVLQGAVAAASAERLEAVLGPCIHGCCNEFGPDLLADFEARFGPAVIATTTWGTPSLHLPAVVAAALAEVGVPMIDIGACTRCHPDRWFSHRRGQSQRHVCTITMMAEH